MGGEGKEATGGEAAGGRCEEKKKDAVVEKDVQRRVKEGGGEERKLVWDREEAISRWVEKEAKRRVGAEVARGDEERARDRGKVAGRGEGWRLAGQRGEDPEWEGDREKGGGAKGPEEEAKRREEEKEKSRRLKERVKRLEEDREQRERRKRNVVWRGLDGKDPEERRGMMERVTEKVLGRAPRIRRVWERRGEGGREVVIVEMEDERERAELLEKYGVVRQRWGIGVDEDLSMEERKARWRLLEKAKEERDKGRKTRVENRRLWVEGREIAWNDVEERWEEI